MEIQRLEQHISELRSRPLLLLCRTPKGQEKVMTVGECVEAGAIFIHIVADDLDALLAETLGERS